MNYRIFFTDIDGTLLTDQKTVSDRLRNAMGSYLDNGGRIVLSSGRPLPAILEVAAQLKLPARNLYIIAYNGALVYDLNAQKAIRQQRVPLSLVRQVLDLAHAHKIHCHTYTDDTIISEFDTPELHSYVEHIHMPYAVKEDAVSYLSSLGGYMPYKLLAVTLDDRQKLTEFSALLTDRFADQLHCFFSAKCYLECCKKEASKGNAVRFLCRHLDIDITRSIAAGDAANDISMLQAAGVSYAMRNASPDVQKAASHVTKRSNNEDGLLELFDL